jgi:hypothetical protein
VATHDGEFWSEKGQPQPGKAEIGIKKLGRVLKKYNGCSLQIRDLPLEAFRLPDDGRKWKQLARSRSSLLLKISTFANGDGTFQSQNGETNYSPSAKRLLRHYARDTLYRLSNDLRTLGLLSWHRENHYGRRFYEIHLSKKQVRYSPEEQVRYSSEEQVRYSENQVRQSDVITGPTSSPCPSLEPLPACAGVSGDKQFVGNGGGGASNHHRVSTNTAKENTDDDGGTATAFDNPLTNQQRFKDSAREKIKDEFGITFSDTLIRSAIDTFESRARTVPVSDNFYITSFRNEILNLDKKTTLPSSFPMGTVDFASPTPTPGKWVPTNYQQVVELLQFKNPKLTDERALERTVQFATRTGEFRETTEPWRDELKRERFLERLRCLRRKKIAQEEKRSKRDRRDASRRARCAERKATR